MIIIEAEDEKKLDIYLADLEVQVVLEVPVLNHLMNRFYNNIYKVLQVNEVHELSCSTQ